MTPNDRGYGLGRSAGGFPVAKRQKEMRAQRPLNARQPANGHRRVLAVRAFQSLVIMFNSLKTSFVNSIRICPNVFKSVVSFEATFVAK